MDIDKRFLTAIVVLLLWCVTSLVQAQEIELKPEEKSEILYFKSE